MSRSWPEYFRSRLRGKSTLSLVEVVSSSTFSHALRLNTINHQRNGIQKNNFNYQLSIQCVCSYMSVVLFIFQFRCFILKYKLIS